MLDHKKRLDWFKFYAMDFVHGTKKMTNEEVGAYIRLLCEAWLNFPDVAFQGDLRTILGAMPGCSERRWQSIAGNVLSKFKPVNQVFKGSQQDVFINQRLIDERNEALRVSDNAKSAANVSANVRANASANAQQMREQEEKRREEGEKEGEKEKFQSFHPSCKERADMKMLDEVQAGHIDESMLGGLKKGDIGYFHRGQYSGTKPRDIWEHMTRAWIKARGESAISRMPTKHPKASTDRFKDLCDGSSGDLLVPAFEIWANMDGQYYSGDYPAAEFCKVAGTYTVQVLPLNVIKPTTSQEEIDISNESFVKNVAAENLVTLSKREAAEVKAAGDAADIIADLLEE